MDNENPDEKDGSKVSGEKNYRGVQKKGGKFMARFGSGPNRYLGLFNTAAEAARAYDVRARETYGPQAELNFPDSHTDDNSSPATESAMPKNKRKKRKHIIVSDSDAVEAGPCAQAVQNVPQFHAEDDFLPATGSALPIRPECANNLDEQHLEKSVLAEVSTTGGTIGSPGFTTIAVTEPHAAAEEVKLPTATNNTLPKSVSTTGGTIGSPGFTTIAVTEPHAAAEEVKLPTATNNTLPVAESSVTGVANRSESANIPIEQEEVNKYTEYVQNLFEEEDDPDDQKTLKHYVEDLNNLLRDKKGSKSS